MESDSSVQGREAFVLRERTRRHVGRELRSIISTLPGMVDGPRQGQTRVDHGQN